jgi:hypothetical protein
MSDNGQPTWTVGERQTTWSGHAVVYRSPQRRHNEWAELYHRYDDRRLGDPIPEADEEAVYAVLESHLVSLGGVPAADVIADLTPWEAYWVFGAMWLAVPPTRAEQGESGAPSP